MYRLLGSRRASLAPFLRHKSIGAVARSFILEFNCFNSVCPPPRLHLPRSSLETHSHILLNES